MPQPDVLSIPAGRTFTLVEKHKIHACPDTSDYNYRPARYMAFRKSGGEMDALYPFEQVLTVDPYDATTVGNLEGDVGKRIVAYIEERHRTAGFRHQGEKYKFYNLLEVDVLLVQPPEAVFHSLAKYLFSGQRVIMPFMRSYRKYPMTNFNLFVFRLSLGLGRLL